MILYYDPTIVVKGHDGDLFKRSHYWVFWLSTIGYKQSERKQWTGSVKVSSAPFPGALPRSLPQEELICYISGVDRWAFTRLLNVSFSFWLTIPWRRYSSIRSASGGPKNRRADLQVINLGSSHRFPKPMDLHFAFVAMDGLPR